MKEPPVTDADRCMDIRCRCKRGEYISPLSLAYCEEMLKAYPEWYSATQHDVIERTKPFGAQ